MKWLSEMLQNLHIFGKNENTHVVFFVFHFVLLYIFPNECPDIDWGIWGIQVAAVIGVFTFQKYGKFVSISLGNFIPSLNLLGIYEGC